MKTNPLVLILVITGTILLIPLIAMQYTDEVKWSLLDFMVAAMLLLGTGFLIELVVNKFTQNKYRVPIVLALVLALIFIWAEMAVGILGTPISGF
jgi:hypothetical protein